MAAMESSLDTRKNNVQPVSRLRVGTHRSAGKRDAGRVGSAGTLPTSNFPFAIPRVAQGRQVWVVHTLRRPFFALMPRLSEITRFRLGNLQRAPEEETQTTEGDQRKKQLHTFLEAAKQSELVGRVSLKPSCWQQRARSASTANFLSEKTTFRNRRELC